MMENEYIRNCSEEVKLGDEASECISEGCRNQKWHGPQSCATNTTVEESGKLNSDYLPLNILSSWSESNTAASLNLDSEIRSMCTSNTQSMMASAANTLDDVTHARRPDDSETLDITSAMTHMIKTDEVIPAFSSVNNVFARKKVSSASKNTSSKTANTIRRETSSKMAASRKFDSSDQSKLYRKQPYHTCPHCRKSVRDLSKHIITHSEERPHLCVRLFKYSCNLLAHGKVCQENKTRQGFAFKSDQQDSTGTCTQMSGFPVQLHDFSMATPHPGPEELAKLWSGLATDVCDTDEPGFIPVGYAVKMPSHLLNVPLNTDNDHLIAKKPQTKVADQKMIKKANKKPPKRTETDQISTTNTQSNKTNTTKKSTLRKRSAKQRSQTSRPPVRRYIYQCTQCTNVYKQKSHLERHERTHSDEKRHVCQNCGRGFRERYQLWSHERRNVC